MSDTEDSAMTEENKKWQIESDARTLKEAEIIKADAKRVKPAQDYLKKELSAIKTATLEDEEKKRFPTTYKEEGKK